MLSIRKIALKRFVHDHFDLPLGVAINGLWGELSFVVIQPMFSRHVSDELMKIEKVKSSLTQLLQLADKASHLDSGTLWPLLGAWGSFVHPAAVSTMSLCSLRGTRKESNSLTNPFHQRFEMEAWSTLRVLYKDSYATGPCGACNWYPVGNTTSNKGQEPMVQFSTHTCQECLSCQK